MRFKEKSKIFVCLYSLILISILYPNRGSARQDIYTILEYPIYIQFENVPLDVALDRIAKESKLEIIYDVTIPRERMVELDVHGTPLQDVLQQLLQPHALTFVPHSNMKIYIRPASSHSTIHGQILEENTEKPVPFANIFLENTPLGTQTDEQGYYQITRISVGIYRLAAQAIGYEPISIRLNLEGGKNVEINFSLAPTIIETQEIIKVAEAEDRIYQPQISKYTFKAQNLSLSTGYALKDVYRTLQSVPGVVVTNDYKSQLYVRGGNSDQNLVLFDGSTMYNPFHFSGIMSAFDVDALDAIDLFVGGFSAAYGGRLSSVLDIKTRKGKDDFSCIMDIGPIGAKALLEGPLSNCGNILLSGRRSYISNAGERLGGRVLPDFYDGIGRIDFDITPDDNLSFSGFWGQDRVRLAEGDSDDDLTTENQTEQLHYQRIFNQAVRADINLSYGRFVTKIPPPSGIKELQKNHLEDKSAQVNLYCTINKSLQLHVGSAYHQISILYRSFDPILTEIWIDKLLREMAFFAQGQWKVHEKWDLDVGLRTTQYDIKRKYIFEPRLTLQYKPYNILALKGAFGLFSQNLVSIYNENDTYNPVDIWLPPEDYLKTATAQQFIFGLTYLASTVNASVEVYLKNYDHLTQYNRERLEPEDPFFIQGQGEAMGIDCSLQWIHAVWQLWISYSLSKATKELPFRYPQPGVEVFFPRYDRRHTLNLSAEFSPTKRMVCSARFALSSGSPFGFMTGGYVRWSGWVVNKPSDYPSHHPDEPLYYLTAIQSKRDAFRFPWYHRLDISVKYSFNWKHWTISPYTQILNVYDHSNVLYYDTNGTPRLAIPFQPLVGVEIKVN